MAAGWSKAVTLGEDWVGEVEGKSAEHSLNQGSFEKQMPLASIACPNCGAGQDPKGMRLITSVGFSNVMCKACKGISLSSIWKCRCRVPWIKCPRHEHVPNQSAAKPNGRIQRSRTGKSFDKRGRDVPVPIKRTSKSKYEHPVLHVQHNRTSAVPRIRLEPGSRLAAKFPHVVKAAAPTSWGWLR